MKHKFFNLDASISNFKFDWVWVPRFDFAEPLADQLTDGCFNFNVRWGYGLFKVEIIHPQKEKHYLIP